MFPSVHIMRLKKQFLFCFFLFIHAASHSQITANWHLTGPANFPVNISGQINGIGRTTQIKFDPVDSNWVYATTASGGLFISSDQGHHWHVAGTDQLPALSCASVAIDYSNTNILYLGTGDPNYYGQSFGIWKTTDGGLSWNASHANIGNRMALEILIDPANPSVILAATDDGIWKSYDAGLSWTEKFTGGSFTDMISKPGNGGDTLYACTYSEFYRSTNRGETWTPITNGVYVPGGNGNGMRIGVSHANPEVVYLGEVVDGCTILKSTNGGTSFSTIYHNPAQMLNGYTATTAGQGNYNFDITVDPDDANIVYVAAHCVWKSTDGGITWAKLTNWWAGCHTDMHHLVHNPYNHQQLFNANDGGIFLSTDGGNNWNASSDGLAATECYHAAQSNLNNRYVSIGTQDNGELYYHSNWFTNRGGDWGEKMSFDYSANNRVYYHTGNRRIVNGGDQSWNPPFSSSTSTNDVVMTFTPLHPNTAFVGAADVWRTDNLNSASPVWTLITYVNTQVKAIAVSPVDDNEVYIVLDNNLILHSLNAMSATPTYASLSSPYNTAVSASMAIAKNNPNIIYLTCGKRVYRSANQGTTWTNITGNLPGVNQLKIYHDDYSNNGSVYVGSAKGVYFRNDTMSNWVNYSQGLPTIADIRDFMMYNDGSPNAMLRVAYYGRGVWESKMYQPFPVPAADLTVDMNIICRNSTVHFTDLSTSNTTAWNWSFPGGTPSSSTLQNPTVLYTSAGSFPVTLVASNNNGNDTVTINNYMNVTNVNPLPLTEGFSSFLPPEWYELDVNNDGLTWYQTTSVGGYGNSMESAWFDNYNQDANGRKNELRTPHYDLSQETHVNLSYDYAYSYYGGTYSDSLAVFVLTDCDTTITQVYVDGGATLATAPQNTSSTFVPTSTQWNTQVINLDAFAGMGDVSVAFQNIGYYGQALYLDNINMIGNISGIIHPAEQTFQVKILPNPSGGKFELYISSPQPSPYQLIICNALGETMLCQSIAVETHLTIPFDFGNMSKGIYFLALENMNGENVLRKKIVIE